MNLNIIESKDFDLVYESYKDDFPKLEQIEKDAITEKLNEGHYKLYLGKDGSNIVGYILAYQEDNAFLWMDYLAILKEYRNKGYGKLFLNALKQKVDYIIFEVEYNDGIVNSTCYKREKFYKDLGGKILPCNYALPTVEGKLGMNLFMLSLKNYYDSKKLKLFVRHAVLYIHDDLTHTLDVINSYIEEL